MTPLHKDTTTLLTGWQAAWRELGVSHPDDALYRRLVACYGEPHRRYHTIRHLTECLAHLETLRSVAQAPAEVALALWFHDAVYNPREGDNEGRSAEWARTSVESAGVSPESAERIHGLVIATKHDAIPSGRDAEVIVDVDLAILGAAQSRFDEYERQVREEYAWVPEHRFQSGRRKVLENFAGRESIYHTKAFCVRFETRARENIARSLTQIRTRMSQLPRKGAIQEGPGQPD